MSCFLSGKQIFDADENICYYIAELFRLRKQYRNAITEYSNAIEFSKSDTVKSSFYPSFFSGRAFCFLQKNAYQSAIDDYTHYLRFKPNDATVLINRGVCYQKNKDDSKAVADWEKAAKLGHPTAKEYLKRHGNK